MRYLNLLFLTEATVLLGVFFGLTDEILISDWAMVLKNLFPTDRLVISTQYYALSKITSSLSFIFIILNSLIIFLMVIYMVISNIEIRRNIQNTKSGTILVSALFGLCLFPVYFFGSLVLYPYNTGRYIPTDSFFSLLSMTFFISMFVNATLVIFLVSLLALIMNVCHFDRN